MKRVEELKGEIEAIGEALKPLKGAEKVASLAWVIHQVLLYSEADIYECIAVLDGVKMKIAFDAMSVSRETSGGE